MSNADQLAIFGGGVSAWNKWRKANPAAQINFRGIDCRNANLAGVDLHGAYMYGANFYHANLRGANLHKVDLITAFMDGTDLQNADLREARLVDANLSTANLQGANLRGAILNNAKLTLARMAGADLAGAHLQGTHLSLSDLGNANLVEADLLNADLNSARLTSAQLGKARLGGANLTDADLQNANLEAADLSRAILVRTKIENAILTACKIYGAAVWDLHGNPGQAHSLVITPADQSPVTVDNLAVAQFTYLLLHNDNIRDVINTIGRKGVLILGRFTAERKEVLTALRAELRRRGYLPIVFDFERPTDRDFTETVMTLAGMCIFIIADITKPRSVPLELQATVPNYMIPFVPIIKEGERPFEMFSDLWKKYRDWVLDPLYYDSVANLSRVLDKAVIEPAEQRRQVLQARKAQELITRHVKDYKT